MVLSFTPVGGKDNHTVCTHPRKRVWIPTRITRTGVVIQKQFILFRRLIITWGPGYPGTRGSPFASARSVTVSCSKSPGNIASKNPRENASGLGNTAKAGCARGSGRSTTASTIANYNSSVPGYTSGNSYSLCGNFRYAVCA
eukprot:3183215-Rhodomonas_salina.1